MLSNPSLEPSAGSSGVTSTSRSSKSRMAFVYSVRFRRCSAGVSRLALGSATASRRPSIDAANASSRSREGRGDPLGGIIPVFTLRTAFSQRSRSAAIFVRSGSSTSPPLFTRSLWQVMQYCFTSAASSFAGPSVLRCGPGSARRGEAGGAAPAGATRGTACDADPHTMPTVISHMAATGKTLFIITTGPPTFLTDS